MSEPGKPDPLGGLGGGAHGPAQPDPHGEQEPHEPGPAPHPAGLRGARERESVAVRFHRVRKVAPTTVTLLSVLCLAFLVQCWAGGWSTTDGGALFRLGGLSWLAVDDGDWWRLGSYAFLHVGLPHLLLNGWALWMLMRPLEGVFGPVGSLGIWAAGVFAGGFASFAWARAGGSAWVLSAGASGGVVALFGARLGLLARLWGRLDPVRRRAELFALLFNLAFNVLFAIQAATGGLPLDNAAHLGGLFAGALLALAAPIPALGVRLHERLVGLALLLFCFGLAACEGAAAARAARPHQRTLHAGSLVASLPSDTVPYKARDGQAFQLVDRLHLVVQREEEHLDLSRANLPVKHLGARDWLSGKTQEELRSGTRLYLTHLLTPDGSGRLHVQVAAFEQEDEALAQALAEQVAASLR
jgi:membrane associated rhomboid family serine protease